MLNVTTALAIIRDLNYLAPADAFGNHAPENREYFRGQVELLRYLMGDGWDEELFILERLGVSPEFAS